MKTKEIFSLFFILTALNGCDLAVIPDMVVAGGQPVACFTVASNGCQAPCDPGFSSACSTNSVSYLWDFGDGTTSTQANPGKTYSAAGSYQVSLTVSGNGQSDETTTTVTVNATAATSKKFIKTQDIDATSVLEFAIGADEKSDGYYLAVNTYQKVYLAKFDKDAGNLSGAPAFFDPGSAYPALSTQNFKKVSNGYAMSGFCNFTANSVTTDDFYFIKLKSDFSLETGQQFFDQNEGAEIGRGFTETDDGGYLICGGKSTNTNAGVLLIKLNSAYQLQSRKNLFTGSPNNYAEQILNTASGYAVSGQIVNPSSGQREGCFFQLNNNLDLTGTPVYFGNFNIFEILPLPDGGFILIGGGLSATRIVRVSATGGVVWDKGYGPGLFRSGFLSGESVIAAGKTGSSPNVKAALFRVKTEDGTVEWQRDYLSAAGKSSDAFFVMKTSDNGYLVAGTEINLQDKRNTLLIKTDEQGMNN